MKKTKEITGNALRTYLYLVTHGPSGLRDVQRGVGLSTPSLASYHLSRLVEAGYVRQDEEGRYVASEESSTEILEGYVKVGTALVPQFLFFAVLFTILIVFFSLESLLSTGFTIYLITASLAMVVLLWYESLRLWRRLVVDSANRQTND
ncbi:MAG: winged helix-turn-helix domain-containing protein [Candidatus Bathyarchaeia archaeon]